MRFITWGSMAAILIVVVPSRQAFAMRRDSVAVTANPAEKLTFPDLTLPENRISSSSHSYIYPIASSPRTWSHTGLFPITHHPGCGISSDPNRAKSAGKRRMLARIFLTSVLLSVVLSKCVVSISSVFHSKFTWAQRDLIISTNVKISPIRGTFSKWAVLWNRHAAMSGSAAFLDPEIWTFPERDWGQLIQSIGSYCIEKIHICKSLQTLDAISNSPNRLDFYGTVEFFTNIFDMSIYGAIIEIIIISDNIFHERFTLDNTLWIFDDIF